MLRRTLILLVAGLLQVSLVVPHSEAVDRNAAAQGSAAAACRLPDDAAARAGGTRTPNGHLSYEAWLAGEQGQRAAQRLGAWVKAAFGEGSKLGRTEPLQRGLIGTAVDHTTQRLVIVVDPQRVDVAGLRQQAQVVAPVATVQSGCHSAGELLVAERVLFDRSWHPDAKNGSFSYYLDPKDSTYHVALGDTEVAAALRQALGSRVTVEPALGGVRTARMLDGEPHYGGAAIGAYGQDPDCTSGFTVRDPFGGWGSVTAGHCLENNAAIYSGNRQANRWEYYGYGAGESGFPTWDMIGIQSYTETYDKRIYVDPCCPSIRQVAARWDPVVGLYVCHSGMRTKAVCGLYVSRLDGAACHPQGCTTSLIVFDRSGQDILTGGDSGGPLYSRLNATEAAINGLLVAADCYQNDPTNCIRGYAEKVSTVEYHLGVTVRTS